MVGATPLEGMGCFITARNETYVTQEIAHFSVFILIHTSIFWIP